MISLALLCKLKSTELIKFFRFFSDGGWSSWSGWSGCAPGQCAGDQKVRTRTCTNPTPDSGGAYCSGDNAQNADCPGILFFYFRFVIRYEIFAWHLNTDMIKI